jgi:DNA-binding MarR family transcriptional regulator
MQLIFYEIINNNSCYISHDPRFIKGLFMHNNQDIEQSLFFLIRRISKAFREKLNHAFDKAGHDVTSEQWRILKCLWQNDGQIQQNLADIVHNDKTCITRVIDAMEKRNLVVRIPDKLDRRQKLIYLTNKGKELQEELMGLVQKASLEAQQGIEPERLDILKEVLEKIYNNLSDS